MKLDEMTQDQAFELFDSLSTVTPAELIGRWQGAEIKTGHPMDGFLTASRWFGKDIKSVEDVHPLLFTSVFNNIFSGNPGLLPIENFTNAPRTLIKVLFAAISPFVHTKKGRARLRVQEYRGRTTTAMLYDQKALIDMFVRIDDETLLGVSDAKWIDSMGYFFTLTKV